MQHQRTPPKKTDFPRRELNAQELVLIEAIAGGADNCEAYRAAYGAEGYSPNALRVKACRKVAEPHIQEQLDQLRSVGLANARITLETRLEEERAFAKRCELTGNMGAAGGAYDRINKLMGLYVEKVEHATSDPMDALKQLAKEDPEHAAWLAAKYNVQVPSDDPVKPH